MLLAETTPSDAAPSNAFKVEISADRGTVKYDEEKEEYVDTLTYEDKDIVLIATPSDDSPSDATPSDAPAIVSYTYQWYKYNASNSDWEKISGATDSIYTLTGEDVNAGEYRYKCELVAVYSDETQSDGVEAVICVVIDKADQSLKFAEDSISKTTDDSPFTNDLTGAVENVTYVSSDESVATVDSSGEVTIVGTGTTTITATVLIRITDGSSSLTME